MARPGRLYRLGDRVAHDEDAPRRAHRRLAGCGPGRIAAKRLQRAFCPRLFGRIATARQARALTWPILAARWPVTTNDTHPLRGCGRIYAYPFRRESAGRYPGRAGAG